MVIEEHLPIDKFGRPTTYLSYMLLKYMFEGLNRSFTPLELSRLLAAKYSDIELLVRQLKKLDFIVEDSEGSQKFRYNRDCKNIELQIEFENFLADADLNPWPIYQMLDYSPSYRQKATR